MHLLEAGPSRFFSRWAEVASERFLENYLENCEETKKVEERASETSACFAGLAVD
jgi:hypothetical protein